MKSSIVPSFEAARHAWLPANAYVHLSARDFLILDWLVSETPLLLFQRMVVLSDADRDERVLSEDAYRAVWPSDQWVVDVVPVPMRDGQLARDCLPESSPLAAAPARFQLGLIEVQK